MSVSTINITELTKIDVLVKLIYLNSNNKLNTLQMWCNLPSINKMNEKTKYLRKTVILDAVLLKHENDYKWSHWLILSALL